MSEEFISGTKCLKKLKDKEIRPERYGMIFCLNCKGSGKHFYGKSGVSVCHVCGGFGLVKMERNCINDDSKVTAFVL